MQGVSDEWVTGVMDHRALRSLTVQPRSLPPGGGTRGGARGRGRWRGQGWGQG